MLLRTSLIIITSLILSAHFLRDSNLLLTLVYILLPFVLMIKKRLALLLVQGMAYAGGIIWINTLIKIAQRRISYGEPWIRMAVILGAVALFTILAGLLLNSSKVKEQYPSKH